ncbi:MAG: hypothetical protein V2A73_00675 [Pseudomonadota bacterium]
MRRFSNCASCRYYHCIIAAAIAATAGERNSEACLCAQDAAIVWPRPGIAAPLNTRVLVELPASPQKSERPGEAPARQPTERESTRPVEKLGEGAGQQPGEHPDTHHPSENVAAERPEVTLRWQETVVKTEVRILKSAALTIVELVPVQPLLPQTRYGVYMSHQEGKIAVLIGEFRTGETLDRDAPSWKGVATAIVSRPARRSRDCSTGDQIVTLDVGSVTDTTTPPSQILFGIWPDSTSDDEPSCQGAPLLYAAPVDERILLGQPSRCAPANFAIPKETSSLKLTICAVDLAGNKSTPRRVTVTGQ